jgi:uncharacterized delta-60 repeat protein
MRGETRQRWLALLGLVLVVSACGAEEEEPKPDGLTIQPAHQSVVIAPGGVVSVHIKHERTGNLSGAILVTSTGGPPGVRAEPVVLTSEETEGDLRFQASDAAEVGARGRVLVLSQSGSEAYSASVDVEVIPPVRLGVQTASMTAQQTRSAQTRVSIQRLGGFEGPVRLSIQGLPAGIKAEPQELLLEGNATSALFTLRTHYLTPTGQHPFTFTATASRFSTSAPAVMDITRTTASTWDDGFGTSGWLKMPTAHSISSLAVQPDGRIVIGAGGGDSGGLWIRRFEIDGSLDKTFGNQGTVELAGPTRASYQIPPRVVLQPDGKLLVLSAASNEVFLYRLRPDGTLDTPFGSAGRSSLDFNRYVHTLEMAVLPDGAILLAAKQYFQMECMRLKADGSQDSSHGVSGRTLLSTLDAQTGSPLGLFFDAQGRTLLVSDYRNSAGSEGGIQVFRLTPAGAADATFGQDGQRTYPQSPQFRLKDLARLGDGFAVIAFISKDDSTAGEHWVGRFGERSGTLEFLWRSVAIPSTFSYATLTGLSDGRTVVSTSSGMSRLSPDGGVDTRFQRELSSWTHLITGEGDAIYSASSDSVRRMLPPR